MSDTLLLLVFISLERKDDLCKTGGESRSSILSMLKKCETFDTFSVYFLREERLIIFAQLASTNPHFFVAKRL